MDYCGCGSPRHFHRNKVTTNRLGPSGDTVEAPSKWFEYCFELWPNDFSMALLMSVNTLMVSQKPNVPLLVNLVRTNRLYGKALLKVT